MFFDRPEAGRRALLVHLHLGGGPADADDIAEFEALVVSAGGAPVGRFVVRRAQADARTLVGTGKLEEIHAAVTEQAADVVIFSQALNPGQERNLEKALGCRVLDRVGLILDIFSQRARTHEGKLQVELAQLQHMATRLIRGWTHLERQRGGIGVRGGPGETQLEADRRLLREKAQGIRRQLEKVRQQRGQGRRARQRAELPLVAVVGYTNAGKSTLFNRLTTAGVYAADQLFATLDTTLRRITVPDFGPVILADTVGFIRDLPHKLVEAFRATLEETVEADLLLHVIDAAGDNRQQQEADVDAVLEEIGAGAVPRLQVFNKIDRCLDPVPRIERDADGRPLRVRVSALHGEGMDLLRTAIAECLGGTLVDGRLRLGRDGGRLRARLHRDGLVVAETTDEAGCWQLDLRLPQRDWQRLAGLPEVQTAQLLADAAAAVPPAPIC